MKIIYEDSQILVCYKEAGLPVQSGKIGTKDLVSILKNELWEKNGRKQEPYLGLIHRLDQPVEGILAFAKTPQAAKELSAQVADGRMKKIYRAVVRKTEPDISGEAHLMNYLLKENSTNSSHIVKEGTAGAKRAELDYKIQRTYFDGENVISLVEIHLLTGRHHQIRVQMAGAGMPLLGDRKYGGDDCGDGSLALCAVSLKLIHPKTRKQMEFHCEPQGSYFHIGKFSSEKN